ncbi:hypothetical protein B0T20DRAFT_392682 [Sordaria brevicollis]|uniref:Uncharacterized protein n=1 Tax=Sordaria brevicollis TaxID=83679 RepID=A0AAE0PE75_SORBR|nr:hypothetical protein B0T20DRAFT_392682 [Sordaria brevicollis]
MLFSHHLPAVPDQKSWGLVASRRLELSPGWSMQQEASRGDVTKKHLRPTSLDPANGILPLCLYAFLSPPAIPETWGFVFATVMDEDKKPSCGSYVIRYVGLLAVCDVVEKAIWRHVGDIGAMCLRLLGVGKLIAIWPHVAVVNANAKKKKHLPERLLRTKESRKATAKGYEECRYDRVAATNPSRPPQNSHTRQPDRPPFNGSNKEVAAETRSLHSETQFVAVRDPAARGP